MAIPEYVPRTAAGHLDPAPPADAAAEARRVSDGARRRRAARARIRD